MRTLLIILTVIVLIATASLLHKENDRSLVLENNVKECQVDVTSIILENPSGKFLSPAEIGEELATKWLEEYKNPLCGTRGIKSFSINEVKDGGESGNDMAVTVDFNVEPNSLEFWTMNDGTVEGNIVRDKSVNMMINRTGNTFYRIVSILPAK
jgi:hypothetical protein